MISKKQAMELKHGDVIHWKSHNSSRCIRWEVSGKPKEWKKDPERFSVPLKRGGGGGDLTNENAEFFHVPTACSRRNRKAPACSYCHTIITGSVVVVASGNSFCNMDHRTKFGFAEARRLFRAFKDGKPATEVLDEAPKQP